MKIKTTGDLFTASKNKIRKTSLDRLKVGKQIRRIMLCYWRLPGSKIVGKKRK